MTILNNSVEIQKAEVDSLSLKEAHLPTLLCLLCLIFSVGAIMEEIWKDIPGYEGYYKASNMGRIKALKRWVNDFKGGRTARERILKDGYSNGYRNIVLSKKGVKRTFRVCRIIALTFKKNTKNYPVVCHNNGRRDDDRAVNLRWDTYENNEKDKLIHNTRLLGEQIWNSKLKEKDVKLIKKLLKINFKQKLIAKMFNISKYTISDIKREKTWKHVIIDEV